MATEDKNLLRTGVAIATDVVRIVMRGLHKLREAKLNYSSPSTACSVISLPLALSLCRRPRCLCPLIVRVVFICVD
jgi:hypothetical protein